MRLSRLSKADRERGSFAMFVVLFTPAVVLLAGLLVDGGMAINARQRAADIAGQAARYAANDIDLSELRSSGEVTVDPSCAEEVARLVAHYPAVTGWSCSVRGGTTVHVRIQITYEAQLLGMIPGLDTFVISAHAEASPVAGL